jgi:hypothetical protein
MLRLSILTLFAGMLMMTAGCDAVSPGTSANGTLMLYLTDNPFPFDLVAEANATISHVEIIGEGGAIVLVDEEQAYNLLTLRDGVTALMSEVELPAGQYAQIRLRVTEADVVLNDGQTFDLFVPSGAQTGIVVLLPGFEVEADGVTELTLDFDVEESFIVLGNPNTPAGIEGFLFQPVIVPLGLTD